MKKLVFSLLFIGSIGFGQTTKNVGDFNKVTSFDKIDVLLIPGNDDKVIVDGKDAEEVELVNKNGELKIRMPLSKMLEGDNISVTVYFKKIDAVEANEGSRIACGDKIKCTAFDIIAKEGSEVKLILEAEKLKSKVADGSKISVEGKAKNQEVLVNTGGLYDAEKLITDQSAITVNAGGKADVFASVLADAKVRAGGDITIFGHPKQINKNIFAGGTIEEAK